MISQAGILNQLPIVADNETYFGTDPINLSGPVTDDEHKGTI